MTTLNAGSGADGNATVSADKNISTESLVGRGYADMIPYQCSSVGSSSCVASEAPNGIVAGDEVLLINWQGISGDTDNVGNYETFIVDSINVNTITFTASKTKNYGNTGGDTNIGTGGTNQRVRVQRIPQYNNLTIDNGYTLTANDAWDTSTGGILFLRAAGTLLVNGSISMTGAGYTGGYNNYSGSWYYRTGAGINGGPRSALKSTTSWWSTSNLGGGARGGHDGSKWACGAGGGYGTVGEDGDDTDNVPETQGGSTYGEETLAKLFLGSGGGSGEETGEESGDVLADGGGAIAIFTTTLDVYGNILCDGQTSVPVPSLQNQPGGAGSGGSILIHAGTIYTRSSTFTAIGAIGDTTPQPGSWKGGDGGDGRIAISYASLGDNLSAVDPTPYTDSGLELPYKISGTASENCTVRVYNSSWVFVTSEVVSAGAYEISNLPNAGPFYVISESDTSGRNLISYKAIVPTQ